MLSLSNIYAPSNSTPFGVSCLYIYETLSAEQICAIIEAFGCVFLGKFQNDIILVSAQAKRQIPDQASLSDQKDISQNYLRISYSEAPEKRFFFSNFPPLPLQTRSSVECLRIVEGGKEMDDFIKSGWATKAVERGLTITGSVYSIGDYRVHVGSIQTSPSGDKKGTSIEVEYTQPAISEEAYSHIDQFLRELFAFPTKHNKALQAELQSRNTSNSDSIWTISPDKLSTFPPQAKEAFTNITSFFAPFFLAEPSSLAHRIHPQYMQLCMTCLYI
ncbi:hypothetical protein BLNAU_802 [Blattamonas nauphoetae]|uniref:Mediator of RNA polymerase II transcription subunit 20 n=1 Tax=Blattamonas nauphoetae TaxID=2049346 RepID=A0ABQ9YKJ3_9EUKA|nr:hypothetical protein BLNAU_802 [Blattamonas nauphoetae]